MAALVAGALLSGCQTVLQEETDMTLDEARAEMLQHLDAVTSTVGTGWNDRYEPATFSCTLPGADGLQWTVEREGSVTGPAQEAADAVARYFGDRGFEVRIRENSPGDVDVIVRAEDGLDIQFGAVDDGFAYLSGQSVCIAGSAVG